MLELSVAECQDFSISSTREWLVTNNLGGYACGTVAGVLNRHYHGLLIAGLRPPLGRMLTLVKLDETAIYRNNHYPLNTDRWGTNIVDPHGYKNLIGFRLEGTTPVWTYAFGDAHLEKMIWMEPCENTTYVRYSLVKGQEHLVLHLKAIVNYRDHHASTVVEQGHWQMRVDQVGSGLQITAQDGATPFYLFTDRARLWQEHIWYHRYHKAIEEERGQPTRDDHLYIGHIEALLNHGEALTVVASIDPAPDLNGEVALERRRTYERTLLETARLSDSSAEIEQLVLAADQFVVQRATPSVEDGRSILAGYPWFSDWGRDTMIALPGITLATGRPEIASKILRTYADYVDQGMIPNRFPDEGEAPEYNTVDATLWFVEAIRATFAATQDGGLLRLLYPTLQHIIEWHLKGTRYNIHVDPRDGLLYSGEADIQLTWMDVKIGDWVVTPRTGKAVEINALWYNALCSMQEFARCLGEPSEQYGRLAQQCYESFGLFWNGQYCNDVIDGPEGDDPTLRPNQLIAISLFYNLLDGERAKAVVDVCQQKLLTTRGLRSLPPDDAAYAGIYLGDQKARDAVYHQGTVWAWLIGPFVAAHWRVYHDREKAKTFLSPLLEHLREGCIGSISEIFDGDPPHQPRGCFAQAWSVAEVLRVWRLIENGN
jgi:predicted glycogen debranching enzyme